MSEKPAFPVTWQDSRVNTHHCMADCAAVSVGHRCDWFA